MSRSTAKPKNLIRAIAGRAVTTSREASAIYRKSTDDAVRAEALTIARQTVRDGIPFGSPENADRAIGWGCAFGLVGVIAWIFWGWL